MNIREIRLLSGLTQKEFCSKYKIPLSTLKNWESDPCKNKSHRKCPNYVEHMLFRLVMIDGGYTNGYLEKKSDTENEEQ